MKIRTRHSRLGTRAASAAAAAVLLCAALSAGVYQNTKHGDPVNGIQRLADEGRGECSQCHDEHASRQGVSTGGPWPYLLFAQNDNALCYTCHNISGSLAIYQGNVTYNNSTHGLSGAMVWPGPTPPGRSSSDAGKCVNCHDPHGGSDGSGQIPAMTFAREEALCKVCHDGSPAADVATDFNKTYKHPIATAGKHNEAEGGDPTKFAAAPSNNRHSECVDCHNPHVAQRDMISPLPPTASNQLLGVSRIRVQNGPAGTRPSYAYLGPSDPAAPNEYEICFKCHSSWTTQPVSQSDLALLLNPANRSYHPVEAGGKNVNIRPGSFANGWDAMRLTSCTDCHSSDNLAVLGAHGSSFEHILKKSYPTTGLSSQTDLCFDCHSYSVYAGSASPDTVQNNSRFNSPQEIHGHAFHVGSSSISCYACHQSHGSATQPALIATGRNPGLTSYSQTSNGGTCLSTCHASKTYTVNYAR